MTQSVFCTYGPVVVECRKCFAPDPFPRSWFGDEAALFLVCWLEASRLFEDIQKRSRAIDSVALRIAHPFYDTRTSSRPMVRSRTQLCRLKTMRKCRWHRSSPTSCKQSHYAGPLRSGGYAEQAAGTKQTRSDSCSTREKHWTNRTMTQIANSLKVLERIGGDDGTRPAASAVTALRG
jgi:hypothetical protein